MVRLIDQNEEAAARQLSEREQLRLKDRISELVNDAVERHGRHGETPEANGSLMELYGALGSDQPRLSDAEELAAARSHVAENNRHSAP